MAKPILDDELWALIEPLLPPPKPRRAFISGAAYNLLRIAKLSVSEVKA